MCDNSPSLEYARADTFLTPLLLPADASSKSTREGGCVVTQNRTLPSRDSSTRRKNDADLLRRLGEVEASCAATQKTLEIQFQRFAAMQAQIDLLMTRQH